jgi:hypothetical protein
MAQDQARTGQLRQDPHSGLLLRVERLPAAVERGKASGKATDDDDGSD